ncbi:hypothetical protein GOP47_0005996 [Adiantum capillus-veneris]|uniref:Cyclic nucleotide-binding domain-containing protein n=1 Tax=Adiantum capillus-veneris TaxID=13818 RepID=A0A9D4ZMM3_ADICA|nr:hypothetical protein GOP47_0005996 [Adiantum capillus-veneris]
MEYVNTQNFRYQDGQYANHDAPYGYNQGSSRSKRTVSLTKSLRRGSDGLLSFGKSIGKGVTKVFAEDHKASERKVLDPNSQFVQQWNKIFLLSCLLALILDPLFFFLPAISDDDCIKLDRKLQVVITVLRSITDTFYLLHMALQFRTAYVAPASRVFGRGELVIDSRKIAKRYLLRDFWLDLVAVLPIPQVVIWIIVPSTNGPKAYHIKNALRYIIFFQFIPRLYLIFPLTSQIVKTAGVITETAWAGAAYNLGLYILASQFLGACWYFLSIERKDTCWRQQCRNTSASPLGAGPCRLDYLYCSGAFDVAQRQIWHANTQVYSNCKDPNVFDLGIYQQAFDKNIPSSTFRNKYLYCLWFGLQQLSSLGQNLSTSTFIGEIVFAILIAIIGLLLFALLIGNMQTYLQSLGVRLEEWRVKQSDTEEWMQHRQLPQDLRERVRRFNQYKWVTTRGVDEERILQSLPADLRRDIKGHLCLRLILQVPLFNEMDKRLLDAVCDRLKPILCTKDTLIMAEGDPVNEMLFIIRGILDSATTNGGRTGFFNQIKLGPGQFCGEELLTWVLDPKPSSNLPTSTRTIRAESEVEAFALTAEDLKFVAKQFRRLHSKKLQHTFRFYSYQWRTWAACFIQAAWKRYKKRKLLAELCEMEEMSPSKKMDNDTKEDASPSLGATIYVSRFAKNAMRGVHRLRKLKSSIPEDTFVKVAKPKEPDFEADAEDAQDNI